MKYIVMQIYKDGEAGSPTNNSWPSSSVGGEALSPPTAPQEDFSASPPHPPHNDPIVSPPSEPVREILGIQAERQRAGTTPVLGQ